MRRQVRKDNSTASVNLCINKCYTLIDINYEVKHCTARAFGSSCHVGEFSASVSTLAVAVGNPGVARSLAVGYPSVESFQQKFQNCSGDDNS